MKMANGLIFDERYNSAKNWGEILHKIFSKDGRIKGCDVVAQKDTITIKEGYFILNGRVIQIETEKNLFVQPGVQNGVLRLLFRIDLSRKASSALFNQGDWQIVYTSEELTKEEINGNGVIYEVEFAAFKIVNGAITTKLRIIEELYLDAEKLEGQSASFFATKEELKEVDKKASDSNLNEVIVLSSNNYGSTLPTSGNVAGRLFFLLDN